MSGTTGIIVGMETIEQRDARFEVAKAVLRVVEKLEPTLAVELITALEAANENARESNLS